MTPGDKLPPGQKVAKVLPALHYGPVPNFEESSWSFRIWGEVQSQRQLNYSQVRSLDSVVVKADLHCVTRFSVLGNEWEGVSVTSLMDAAPPTDVARFVMAHCEYGYEANLPIDVVMKDDVLLAWALNGKDLTPEHGYPLRLVVPSRYGWKSAKWIRGLEFMAKDRPGFWEQRGYHNDADPWREERYQPRTNIQNGRSVRRVTSSSFTK